jgi:hypothetical protein
VLDLSSLDLEEIATALADQTDYEHRWLINPETGEVVFWASGTGIDGQTPVDVDELDLICIDPVPSYIWYQDMADFADQVSDERAGRRLARAIQGKGAFAGSKPSCRRSTRTCCPRGTPSATPGPAVARSSGSPATRSSTTTRSRASSTSTLSPPCRDPHKPFAAMILALQSHICRIHREAESGRLVAVTRVKVVRVGVHLVLEDAIRGSARCVADDEHAPTGNIDPDGIGFVGGSFADRPALWAAGSPPLLPTHRGHLQPFTGTLHQPVFPSLSYG